jgi:hypothetical protein
MRHISSSNSSYKDREKYYHIMHLLIRGVTCYVWAMRKCHYGGPVCDNFQTTVAVSHHSTFTAVRLEDPVGDGA